MSKDQDTGGNEEVAPVLFDTDRKGERLDRFLARHFPDESRASLQRWIKSGRVQSQRELKASSKVLLGEQISVKPPKAPSALPPLQAEDIDLSILYQDDDLIAINKAPGLTVHPGPGQEHGTLVHALLNLGGPFSSLGGKERPGIVHRLDKETSGVLVVARHDRAHRKISAQFKERLTDKTYLALVDGAAPDSGLIDKPLGRDVKDRKKQAIRYDKGRHARSSFTAIERFAKIATFITVKIETGRTHQIRVHMASIGHGVLGDKVYGKARDKATRQLIRRHALHAHKLCLIHPRSEQQICFEAPLPSDITQACQKLREFCPGNKSQ